MKKVIIYREEKEYIAKRAFNPADEYETIRIFEKVGLFRKRDLGYVVVDTADCEDFEDVCCKALDRAIRRDNHHRGEGN